MHLPTNYGSRIVSLHELLRNVCQDLHCELGYAPNSIPAYDPRSPHLFGRFPWYYELASRGRALYVHMPHQFFCGVALPWTGGVRGCLKDRLVLLRPEINGSIAGLLRFAKKLASDSGCSLVVKQANDELAVRLLEHGFRYYRPDEGWDDLAREDDQTFPEVVIDFKETLAAPPVLQRSRPKAKQWSADYHVECVEPIKMERSEIRRCCKHEVLLVFYKWLKHFQKRHPWAVDEAFLNWHLSAFETLVADERLKLLFVRNAQEEPVGVFSLAKTSATQTDVVFSFIAEEDGDFQRLAYRAVFKRISEMEFHYMNLGGSEKKSLFEFKRSLGISAIVKASHLVFDCHSQRE